jgi:XTP/dITP diphosphohydrolase
MKLLFITGNQHKFKEAERILKEYDVIIQRKNIRCEEKRAESCAEVALACLRELRNRVDKPFFVEDSGLFIDSLNGFPGTLSSWVFKKIGNDGILKLMEGERNRNAKFISSVAVWDGEEERVFTGGVKGRISETARGKGGFGYDPIFIPAGSSKTFAEDVEMKMTCSHRKQAFKKMAEWLM